MHGPYIVCTDGIRECTFAVDALAYACILSSYSCRSITSNGLASSRLMPDVRLLIIPLSKEKSREFRHTRLVPMFETNRKDTNRYAMTCAKLINYSLFNWGKAAPSSGRHSRFVLNPIFSINHSIHLFFPLLKNVYVRAAAVSTFRRRSLR